VIAVLLETKVNIALTIVTGVVAIASMVAAFAAIKPLKRHTDPESTRMLLVCCYRN
jgi:hypothetical protein